MIQLEEQDFDNLITDFYTVFAPNKMDMIPNIIERYKGTPLNQLNAIKAAYLKYYKDNKNVYGQSTILSKDGTDQNLTKLMEAYSKGERIISPNEIKKQVEIEQKQIKEQEIQVEKSNQEEKETISSLKKTIEELKNNSSFLEMDYEISSFIEFDKVDDKGKTHYKQVNIDNINFISKKYINSLCIGQRIMTTDKEGFIVGIEVVSIHDDYVSNEGTPIRILELKKL